MTLNVGDVAKGIPMGNATTGGGGGGVSPAEIEELKQEVTTLGQNVTQIGQDVAQVDEEIVSLSSSIDNKQDLLSVNNPLSFTNDYLVVIKDGGVTGNLTSEQTEQMGGVETTGGSYWSITALTFNDAVPEQYYMRKYDPLNPEVVWNRSSNQAEFFWVFVNVTGNKVTPKLIVQGNGGNIGPKALQLDSSTASQSLKKYTVSASNTQRYSKEYYKVQDNGNDTYSILYEDGVTLDVPNLKPSVDKINAVYKYLYPSSVFTGGDINAYTFYDSLESTRQIVYRPKGGDILNTAVGKTLSVSYDPETLEINDKNQLKVNSVVINRLNSIHNAMGIIPTPDEANKVALNITASEQTYTVPSTQGGIIAIGGSSSAGSQKVVISSASRYDRGICYSTDAGQLIATHLIVAPSSEYIISYDIPQLTYAYFIPWRNYRWVE